VFVFPKTFQNFNLAETASLCHPERSASKNFSLSKPTGAESKDREDGNRADAATGSFCEEFPNQLCPWPFFVLQTFCHRERL
jgi:hypothetical protein